MKTRCAVITPSPPFDFDHILSFLRTWPGAVLEVIGYQQEYRRAVYLEGRPALLTVRSDGSVDAPRLIVGVTAEHTDAAVQAAASRTAERIFSTGADVSGLEPVMARDPVLWPVWLRFRGFRPLALPDLFESISWAIIGQQITVRFAAKCKRALTDRYGERLTIRGHEYVLFPRPEDVSRLDEAQLLDLQFSRQKARYIINLARQIVSGEFDLEALWTLPPEDSLVRLQALVGVGRWTAEYVLLRGLGRPDSIPAGDVALQRVIGGAYYGRPATEAEVRLIAGAWAPWRGYAAMCWWFALMLSRQRK